MTLCAVLGSHSGVAEDLRLQECDVLIAPDVMKVRSSFTYKGPEDEAAVVLPNIQNH
jgi:hypothetical protein